MSHTLKIGCFGFLGVVALAILLKVLFNVKAIYIMPFALPWAMVIIIGALRKRK